MPFKTRKQKLAASQRRFTFSDSGLVSWQARRGTGGQLKKASGLENTEEKTSFGEIENLGYVRGEIVRILVLASLLVGAQVLLSFTRP